MSIETCAEILRKSDPDRFLATMTGTPEARAKLFPIYAFNLEVAHLPWVSAEPMIAEMRLQWWQDSIAAVFRGDPPDTHEVLIPLAGVIRGNNLQQRDFSELIEARRRDAYADPFRDNAELQRYLRETSGNLMALAVQALGVTGLALTAARAYGTAAGLANYLLAVPELKARGRQPLPDETAGYIRDIVQQALAELEHNRDTPGLKPALPALLTGCQARPVLKMALKEPARVLEGRLNRPELRRKGRLLWQSMRGRF